MVGHKKYNNGGPVKPKKKEKLYTDRGLYEKALKAYQDSLALNNYYQLQQEIEPEGAYDVKELGYKGALDKVAADIKAGRVDSNKYNVLREYGDRVIDESGGTIQWANRGSSPDLQYYDYSDDESKNFMLRFGHQMGKMITGDDKDNLFYGSSKGWFGDAYNAVWPEPNVKPVYLREDGLKELPPIILEAKARRSKSKERLDSIFSDPVAFDTYLNHLSDKIRGGEKATDTVYFDPYINRYWSAVKYKDGESPEAARRVDDRHDYFDLLPKNYDNSKSSKRLREGMVELPPKLPFANMDLTKVPPLRRVLPEFYGMRLNQQTGEYIYDTSEGEIRKKIGPENAQFVNMHRKAIERMRKNR